MTITSLGKGIKKALRKKTPKTAAQLAFEVTGSADGRTISKALGALVKSGDAVLASGRPKTYVKP